MALSARFDLQSILSTKALFEMFPFYAVALNGKGKDQLVAAPVSEPATTLLMGMGLLGLGIVGRKRLKTNTQAFLMIRAGRSPRSYHWIDGNFA